MLVARKIGPTSNGPEGVSISGNNSLLTAISFYYANRETPVPCFYRSKDGKGKKIMNYGYSVWRVANMHEIAYSLLPGAIAADGDTKAQSEAHKNNMTLTIPDRGALEKWYLHMHWWGNPTRLGLLRSMACAIGEDRERRNLECAGDFFIRMLNPMTAVE